MLPVEIVDYIFSFPLMYSLEASMKAHPDSYAPLRRCATSDGIPFVSGIKFPTWGYLEMSPYRVTYDMEVSTSFWLGFVCLRVGMYLQ